MEMPDTTTCRDAYRAYRQWDDEASRDLEIERLRDAHITLLTSEEGKLAFQDLATSFSFDDDRLHRQGLDLAWCALLAFYGPLDKRAVYRKQIITMADRMSARMYHLIAQEAEKDAEKTIKEIEEMRCRTPD